MPSKRQVLETISRNELLPFLDQYEIEVADRRVKELVVDALASSRKARLEDMLETLSRDTLKAVCRGLGLDDGGRAKAVIVDRILGRNDARNDARSETRSDPEPATAAAPAPAAGPGDRGPAPARSSPAPLTLQQLERHLFAAADIMRGKMDASEFKEYIFGMLFLKRCSDVFEARFEDIVARELAKGRSRAEAAAEVPATSLPARSAAEVPATSLPAAAEVPAEVPATSLPRRCQPLRCRLGLLGGGQCVVSDVAAWAPGT